MTFFDQFPKRNYDLKRDGNLIEIQDIFRNVDVNEELIDTVSAYQFYQIKDGERPDQAARSLYKNVNYYWTFFIVNDHLKKGLEAWPKGYQELTEYIAEEYTKYTIIELKPEDFSKVTAISDYSNLSINRTLIDSPKKPQGKIFKVDPETNQIWISSPSNDIRAAFRGSKPNVPSLRITDTSDGDTFSPSFSPSDGWEFGWQATAYYKDSDGNRIGIYDSPKPGRVTYFEFEEEENEKLRSIRIVKPDQIGAFVDLYETLINE